MSNNNLVIKGVVDTVSYPSSREEEGITIESNKYGKISLSEESEHVGAQIEWFPFQNRGTAQLRPVLGFYAGGQVAYSLFSQNVDSWAGDGRINRYDLYGGAKLGLDVPLNQTVLSPYIGVGPNLTLYDSVCEIYLGNDGEEKSVTQILSLRDLVSPEIGIDLLVPFIDNAGLLINGHAKMLNFDPYPQTDHLLIGGAVGLAF